MCFLRRFCSHIAPPVSQGKGLPIPPAAQKRRKPSGKSAAVLLIRPTMFYVLGVTARKGQALSLQRCGYEFAWGLSVSWVLLRGTPGTAFPTGRLRICPKFVGISPLLRGRRGRRPLQRNAADSPGVVTLLRRLLSACPTRSCCGMSERTFPTGEEARNAGKYLFLYTSSSSSSSSSPISSSNCSRAALTGWAVVMSAPASFSSSTGGRLLPEDRKRR